VKEVLFYFEVLLRRSVWGPKENHEKHWPQRLHTNYGYW